MQGEPSWAERAFLDGERGALGALDEALAQAPPAPWARALAALRWSFDPGRAPGPPAPPDGAAAEASGERRATWLLCSVMRRASLLALDGAAAARWAALERQLGDGDRAPRAVITDVVTGALQALADDRVDEAVAAARRGFLMAQSEALPQLEWLSALALARARRRAGHPHLALHILNALGAVAAPPWHAWIRWEMLLAGGERAARALAARASPALADTPAARAADALDALLAAARAGDHAAFATRAAALGAKLPPDLAREATAVVDALDAGRAPAPALAAWCAGSATDLPLGLYGIGSADAGSDDAVAFVIAAPGRAGRRVLRPGERVAGAARRLPEDPERGGARVETGIAALLLAGPEGLLRDEFFRRVYGFAFVFDLHRNVLEVLVHRVRARLGDAGEVVRGDDPPRIGLDLRQPLAVPDVRCTLPMTDRILRLLAATGRCGADEAAQALHVSARTAQRALQRLTADGVCRGERVGRHIVYRVQDTVFTAITALADRAARS